MHKHNDSQRPVRDLPIRARPGETVLLDSGRVFDVALAVSEILARPQQFECAEVVLSQFAGQIRGPTKLTFHYVAAMGRDDARRPLLLGRQIAATGICGHFRLVPVGVTGRCRRPRQSPPCIAVGMQTQPVRSRPIRPGP